MTIDVVVLDIEGTTSSTEYVHDTLYPYSSDRFQSWIETHIERPEVVTQVNAVRELTSEPDADLARVVWWLHHWTETDQKVTPLKALQGWIWSEGFAKGELTSHFFDDAIPAIRSWHASGRTMYIFSSGSVSAQKAWFGGSPDGDLLPLFTDHFDTENIGPKRVASSYQLITDKIGVAPSAIVFFSDLRDELDAARESGWHTVGVRRKGDQYYDAGVGDHQAITSFAQIDLDRDFPGTNGPGS